MLFGYQTSEEEGDDSSNYSGEIINRQPEVTEPEAFECLFCDKIFNCEVTLSSHVESHSAMVRTIYHINSINK